MVYLHIWLIGSNTISNLPITQNIFIIKYRDKLLNLFNNQ